MLPESLGGRRTSELWPVNLRLPQLYLDILIEPLTELTESTLLRITFLL